MLRLLFQCCECGHSCVRAFEVAAAEHAIREPIEREGSAFEIGFIKETGWRCCEERAKRARDSIRVRWNTGDDGGSDVEVCRALTNDTGTEPRCLPIAGARHQDHLAREAELTSQFGRDR